MSNESEKVRIDFVYKGQPKDEIPRNITNLVVDDSVTEIEDHAFLECRALESATLNEGLKRIGKYAFQSCTSLKKMDVPGIPFAVTLLQPGTESQSITPCWLKLLFRVLKNVTSWF